MDLCRSRCRSITTIKMITMIIYESSNIKLEIINGLFSLSFNDTISLLENLDFDYEVTLSEVPDDEISALAQAILDYQESQTSIE
jgi:hypothetical protein